MLWSIQKVDVDGGKKIRFQSKNNYSIKQDNLTEMFHISEDLLKQLLDKLKKAQLFGV